MTMDLVLTKLDEILALLKAGRSSASPAPAAVGGLVASDADLDGKWGDPVLHKNPPRWQGSGNYAGRKFSECPPDLLDEHAGFLEWKAAKNDAEGKDKFAGYDRSDAARARGWAKRHRAGKVRPVVPESEPDWDVGDADAEAMAGQWDDH